MIYFIFNIINNSFFDSLLNLKIPDNYNPQCIANFQVHYKDIDIKYTCWDVFNWGTKWNPIEDDRADSGFERDEGFSYFSEFNNNVFYTKALAVDYINSVQEGKIVISTELAGYPQPKNKNITRYYLIKDANQVVVD